MFISDFGDKTKISDLEIDFWFVAIFARQEDVCGFDVTMKESFLTDLLKTRTNLIIWKDGLLKTSLTYGNPSKYLDFLMFLNIDSKPIKSHIGKLIFNWNTMQSTRNVKTYTFSMCLYWVFFIPGWQFASLIFRPVCVGSDSSNILPNHLLGKSKKNINKSYDSDSCLSFENFTG
jgi:hypothetical protein